MQHFHYYPTPTKSPPPPSNLQNIQLLKALLFLTIGKDQFSNF